MSHFTNGLFHQVWLSRFITIPDEPTNSTSKNMSGEDEYYSFLITMEMIETLFPMGVQHYLLGGLVIGLGVSLLFLGTGLMGGMSTVFTSSWSYLSSASYFQKPTYLKSRNWRLVYALGLILGAVIWTLVSDSSVPMTEMSVPKLIIGGFIAGFGARLGNGCTSGHGICGMASLSINSIIAVAVFLIVAILTANLIHVLGV